MSARHSRMDGAGAGPARGCGDRRPVHRLRDPAQALCPSRRRRTISSQAAVCATSSQMEWAAGMGFAAASFAETPFTSFENRRTVPGGPVDGTVELVRDSLHFDGWPYPILLGPNRYSRTTG